MGHISVLAVKDGDGLAYLPSDEMYVHKSGGHYTLLKPFDRELVTDAEKSRAAAALLGVGEDEAVIYGSSGDGVVYLGDVEVYIEKSGGDYVLLLPIDGALMLPEEKSRIEVALREASD